MRWSRFAIGFLVVVLLSYIHVELIDKWGGLEISFFMIFFIIRRSSAPRALLQTFLLSLGVDLILQAAQVKGLAAMSRLLVVYAIMQLKRTVVPLYEDLFLLGFFAVFFILDYLINKGISAVFGVYYPDVTAARLLFLALAHTAIMATLLMISLRFEKERA